MCSYVYQIHVKGYWSNTVNNCSQTGNEPNIHQVNNTWFIHAVEYYTAMRTINKYMQQKCHHVEQISQIQKIHDVWFYLYNVPKQTKLTYALRNYDSGYPWGGRNWKGTWRVSRVLVSLLTWVQWYSRVSFVKNQLHFNKKLKQNDLP